MFIGRFLRVSPASLCQERRRKWRMTQRRQELRLPPTCHTLISETHSQSEGAPPCYWPIRRAVRLSPPMGGRCGVEVPKSLGTTWGVRCLGPWAALQALSSCNSVLIAYRGVGVESQGEEFSPFLLYKIA